MARRTKKDKLSASKKRNLASSVKGQLKEQDLAANARTRKAKNADILAQEGSGKKVRSDIIKSLILVSFVLSLELVVYLVWSVK